MKINEIIQNNQAPILEYDPNSPPGEMGGIGDIIGKVKDKFTAKYGSADQRDRAKGRLDVRDVKGKAAEQIRVRSNELLSKLNKEMGAQQLVKGDQILNPGRVDDYLKKLAQDDLEILNTEFVRIPEYKDFELNAQKFRQLEKKLETKTRQLQNTKNEEQKAKYTQELADLQKTKSELLNNDASKYSNLKKFITNVLSPGIQSGTIGSTPRKNSQDGGGADQPQAGKDFKRIKGALNQMDQDQLSTAYEILKAKFG